MNLVQRASALTSFSPKALSVAGAKRTPYFCSGCPHNTSTKIPEGSQASSGIGCHVMASWMGRNTGGFAQMGGEGVPHVVVSMFNGNKHRFQNMGEGTWYHSGSLAVRQAVAAKTNITFKILYNDAVAMTGGQAVDGPISPLVIAQSCRAEGVERLIIVSDDINQFNTHKFPDNTAFHDRKHLDAVQRELREVEGVSVILYVQVCATEKRRRLKRNIDEDPKQFVVINELVCEGCGDCSVESNCLSVEPLPTEFGIKRKINQSTCNKDFSCTNGFCPSFVTVQGGVKRLHHGNPADVNSLVSTLAVPPEINLSTAFNMLVTGVGGTGVVTVGALITMAAHLENKGASVLDFTGFAQKFGTVLSYVRLAANPANIHQARIDEASANAVIGCDIVATSSPKASVYFRSGTGIVLNKAEMPTGDVVLNRDANLRVDERRRLIESVVGSENVCSINANSIAESILGDSVFANVILLGLAWQRALVPVGLPAMMRAIELNDVAIEKNKTAFSLGRILAVSPQSVQTWMKPALDEDPKDVTLVTRRADFLLQYQDGRYAARYRATLDRFEKKLNHVSKDEMLTMAAKSLFKLMAYKDEYEVARLHSSSTFSETLDRMFEPGYTLNYHLSPPLLQKHKDARGRPGKRTFGPGMKLAFIALASCRKLRGTKLDPFGYQKDRKMERELIGWYEEILEYVSTSDRSWNESDLKNILKAPMDIRGYGPVKEKAAAEVRGHVEKLISTT